VFALANFLGDGTTFYNIKKKEQITAFLDTTVKRLVGEDDSCHGFITPLPTILPSFSICRAFPARYGIHLRIEP
jgi:hypothetical protein